MIILLTYNDEKVTILKLKNKRLCQIIVRYVILFKCNNLIYLLQIN